MVLTQVLYTPQLLALYSAHSYWCTYHRRIYMSSTNRGYERHATDYYNTPTKCIRDFLSEFLVDESIDRPDRMFWCDPCAGGDAVHPMAYPSVIEEEFGTDVVTLDIREDSLAEVKADYLSFVMLDPKPDIIITNPPFYLAKEIIQKSLLDVSDGGYVIMLLRLNFFGSKDRKQFLQNTMPKYAYVHSRRMSFTDDGKTDSIEYMHAVWKKGHNPEFTQLKII